MNNKGLTQRPKKKSIYESIGNISYMNICVLRLALFVLLFNFLGINYIIYLVHANFKMIIFYDEIFNINIYILTQNTLYKYKLYLYKIFH